jgi:hypothetical protein
MKPPKGGQGPHVTQPSIGERKGKSARTCGTVLCATKRSEFSSTPSFREAQGSPPKADPVTGAPFLLVRFLWASKENEQKIINEDRKDHYKSII